MLVKLLLTLLMLISLEARTINETESMNHVQTESSRDDNFSDDGFNDFDTTEFDDGLKMAEELNISVDMPKPLACWEVWARRMGTPIIIYYVSLRVWLSIQSNNLYDWYLKQATTCPFGFGKKE